MSICDGYTFPPLYRYIITFECGAELITTAPELVGSTLPCGCTEGHRTSTVTDSKPERH